MSSTTKNGSPFSFPVKSQHEFYVLLSTLAMCTVGLIIILCIFFILRKKYPKLYWRTSLKNLNILYRYTEMEGNNTQSCEESIVRCSCGVACNGEGHVCIENNIFDPHNNTNSNQSHDTLLNEVHTHAATQDYEQCDPLTSIDINICRNYENNSTKCFIKILFSTLFASNEWIYRYLGLDTLVLISTMRLFLLLSSICGFFNLVCVIPTNIISNTTVPINTTNIISRIGVSNIPKGSSLLWVHLVLLYAYSILMYLLIYYYWKNLVYWKQQYFVDNSALHRSFIIQNLPSDMVDERDIASFLKRYIKLDSDKTILYVFKNSFHLIKHLKECDKMLFKLSLYKQMLLENCANISNDDNTTQFDSTKIKNYHTYVDEYRSYVESMHMIRDEAAHLENVPFAFISFSAIEAAHTLAISDINIDINTQNCIVAPEPHGIQYRNFIHSNYTRLTLKIIVWISTMVFVMFWTLPFTLISRLSNSINYPQFDKFKQIHPDAGIFFQSVIRSIIPMSLLMLFYLVLPFIMQFLSLAEGHISKMIIDISVFTKFSIFHIINTYFVFLISEALVPNIQKIITKPFSISDRFVEGLPNQSNFFTIYIIFFTHIVNPYEFLQFVPLIRHLYMKRKKSKFQINVSLRPLQPNYPHMYSRLLYIFGIGLSQSLISPFLTIVWNAFFFSAYITYTFLELFINRRSYSYKGMFWICTINWMTVYLIIFQLLMIGIFALKEVSQINIAAIPLPIFTMILHMYIKSLFTSKYINMSLETLGKIPEASINQLMEIKNTYDIQKQLPKSGCLSSFTLPRRFRPHTCYKQDLNIFRELAIYCKQFEKSKVDVRMSETSINH